MEKYKIERPEQFIDILAIWGDTSDNIPGIPGVGEKTSIKLISTYGSIQGIYDNIDKLKGKQKENVENSVELVKLSKKLVTIPLDVPVKFSAEELTLTEANYEALENLFNELEFSALIKRIIPNKIPFAQGTLFATEDVASQQTNIVSNRKSIKTENKSYYLTDTIEKRKKLIETLSKCDEICFDTETTSIDAHIAELVGIAFSVKEDEAFYVPIPENTKGAEFILNDFKDIFENENITKIGQNIKYDITVIQKYNIKVKGKLFDTMLAHYLLFPEKRHKLDLLAETYLNYETVKIESLIGEKGKNQKSMREVSPETVKDYACEDADITLKLKNILHENLVKENLLKLAEEIEFPLVYVLSDIESFGVKIDTDVLKLQENELSERILAIENKIYELSGENFNIASPKQLGIVLFEKLKITDKPKLTKTKQYATGESELLKLQGTHEIIDLILKYRTLSKLVSTYISALPKLINERTGKIHTSFNQAVTSTGRLSSTKPNLQNIPIRTADGRKIREAFIPSNEYNTLFAADYSQIELRIMAHLSQDEGMIQAFADNLDIHSSTASKIFNVDIKELTKEMRSTAKSANFGIIYGISAFGLSENLKISRSEAKTLIDDYFNNYPRVKQYMTDSIASAREKSMVTTLSGRKRILQDIHSNNSLVRGIAERNAINSPIQGTAADIIKIAMINCYKRIEKENLNAKMILQVHDELVFDTPKAELENLQKIIKEEMENAIELSVPLIVDSNSGENWLIAH